MKILCLKSLIFIGWLFPALGQAQFSAVKKCLQDNSHSLSIYRSTAVAVVSKDKTEILLLGKARADQIFEIGSITKTFTANLLAQEVASGALRLSDPIPQQYQKPGAVITYQHLTTHTSGIIQGVFPKYKILNPEFPYQGLNIILFKDFYAKTDLVSLPGSIHSYSNVGVGLLGLVLAERYRAPYEKLVQEKVFRPLGMKDSYFIVPRSEMQRFPQGIVNGKPNSYWDLAGNGIGPAGGIRSTISDMAIYARANLIPESTLLARAIRISQQPLFSLKQGWIAMNWYIESESRMIWHNGSTFAFNSMLGISSRHNVAVVVLTDTGLYKPSPQGPIKDLSFQNIVFECLK